MCVCLHVCARPSELKQKGARSDRRFLTLPKIGRTKKSFMDQVMHAARLVLRDDITSRAVPQVPLAANFRRRVVLDVDRQTDALEIPHGSLLAKAQRSITIRTLSLPPISAAQK